jgi:1,4-alpha-glucan branching enzyme
MSARHGDPFSVLGLHDAGGGWVARASSRRRGVEAETRDGDRWLPHPRRRRRVLRWGGIRLRAPAAALPRRNAGGEWVVDRPYSFGPVLGPMDDYFIGEGTHLRLFDKLGAHPIEHEGVEGVHFAVWAPNARRVSVVGDFNDWDGRRHPMRLRATPASGRSSCPDHRAGHALQVRDPRADGRVLPLKADPFAFRPSCGRRPPRWSRRSWRTTGGRRGASRHWRRVDARRAPISIYEVHPGSWQRRADGRFSAGTSSPTG